MATVKVWVQVGEKNGDCVGIGAIGDHDMADKDNNILQNSGVLAFSHKKFSPQGLCLTSDMI